MDFDGGVKLFLAVCGPLGLSRFVEPYLLKRMARAKVEEMKLLAEGKIEVARMHREALSASSAQPRSSSTIVEGQLVQPDLGGALPTLTQRTRARIEAMEERRQDNIERVVVGAYEELEGQSASPDPVDPDWLNNLFHHAQEISSEQMQSLWARILAREVRRPGSFSARTLELVRNLTAAEASAFEALLPQVCAHRYLLALPGHPPPMAVQQLNSLSETGLLIASPDEHLTLSFEPGVAQAWPIGFAAIAEGTWLHLPPQHQRRFIIQSCAVLTTAGVELALLRRSPGAPEFAQALLQYLTSSGVDARLSTGPSPLENHG